MNIPKKLNYKYGIPLSSKPILFGYKHSNDAIENFNLLEGDMAKLQLAHVSSTSRLRVIDKSEWKQNGFFVVKHEGYEVVIQKFDVTQVKLSKQNLEAKSIADASVDTQGDFKESLEVALNRISELEAKLSPNAANEALASGEKAKADADTLKDNLSDAGVVDIDLMAEQVEDDKVSKSSKPIARKKPAAKPKAVKVGR